MKSVREEELIAYHLGEMSRWQRMQLRRQLERDADLAAESEEIAATLRAFAADSVMPETEAALDRSWERVRGSLGVLDSAPRSRKALLWAGAGVVAVGALALAVVMQLPSKHLPQPVVQTASNGAVAVKSWSQSLLQELHTHKPVATPFNNRPGPLTTAPVDAVAEDPQLAMHLDTAERVLTEVSHADGPLQQGTREQVHRLLLENAVYRQSAEQHGDMATAAVIDDLGRVLISLDAEPTSAEPQQRASDPDAFRLHMNIGGVLLDLRILHHNDKPAVGQ